MKWRLKIEDGRSKPQTGALAGRAFTSPNTIQDGRSSGLTPFPSFASSFFCGSFVILLLRCPQNNPRGAFSSWVSVFLSANNRHWKPGRFYGVNTYFLFDAKSPESDFDSAGSRL